MKTYDIGLIGLAVMGENLVLNMESKGFSVAVYNRTEDKTRKFAEEKAAGKNILPTYSIKEFVDALEKPRKVMLMVKAGAPVDKTIESLLPYLDKGDLIIDGGNSDYQDTERRSKELEAKGFLYIGTGVSGGEEGALKGPSIMPGGKKEAYELVEPIFTRISAQVDGDACSTHIGQGGAGHFVKMVHNGIEYGDMQLITEAYMLLKHVLGMDAEQLHQTFNEWNSGDLDSYLIEITADILGKTDPDTGKPMVDVILDKAGQKGTGKWTVRAGLDLGVSVPTIAEAVFARIISSLKDERVAASGILQGPKISFDGDPEAFKNAIRDALYASKICSYAQGFGLMQAASDEYGWDLNFGGIAMIWRGGCIIRAHFLQHIKDAYDKNPDLKNLLLDPYFKESIHKSQDAWREVVATASRIGIPIPAFSSALSYFDSYRLDRLGANLLQAQRDYFGAHTYERVDKDGSYHTEWLKI
ncbi:NADP-dependent phosphogluconate dehydrogenase [Balneolales bacterium ANBcel1]|nr:NADP-dependent phosphogluconate dehydrogenase [Balneolales bacterium ANBcel1]